MYNIYLEDKLNSTITKGLMLPLEIKARVKDKGGSGERERDFYITYDELKIWARVQ